MIDPNGDLVLAPGVTFVPLAALSVENRTRFGTASGWVVTGTMGRAASMLLDDDGADLLREFMTRTSVVTALLRFSYARGLEPSVVLERAYSTLMACVERGFLVGEKAVLAAASPYSPGDLLAGGTVLGLVQRLNDNCVYRVEDPEGRTLAVKTSPVSSISGINALDREATVLRHLGGHVAPQLMGAGRDKAVAWLAMEWCPGLPVLTRAAALRAVNDDAAVADLTLAIVRSYERLHRLGVVHGDVHPGNIVIGDAGSVRVLDFGLARLTAAHIVSTPPRGGAPHYLTPDQAQARLDHSDPGVATTSSDIYGVAALLYELITGQPYLDFSLDEEEMLTQIVSQSPRPFERCGLQAWPRLEATLARGLSKEPERRTPSMQHLEQDLIAARRTLPQQRDVPSAVTSASTRPRTNLTALLDDVVARVLPGGSWHANGSPTSPLVSVAFGAAGVAVALHHLAMHRQDPALLSAADEWAANARARATDPQAYQHPQLTVTEELTGAVTPFHRASGVHATEALVSHARGDDPACARAVEQFTLTSLWRPSRPEKTDLVLGTVGTLLAAAILHETLSTAAGGQSSAQLQGLRRVGESAFDQLWTDLDASPAIAADATHRYLGIAHGWAGFLLATLRWCRTTDTPLPDSLSQRADELAGLGRPAGSRLQWPWTSDGAPAVPGWCNGSAGYVHLWIACHETLGQDRWLTLAERAALDATQASTVSQLCCGLAGQAYALLALHRHTGDRTWHGHAARLAEQAATRIVTATTNDGCIPGSLHKGELGVGLLAADLENPERASMPFFGPPL